MLTVLQRREIAFSLIVQAGTLGGRIGLWLCQCVGAGLLDWASRGVECRRAVPVPSCQLSPFLEGRRLVLATVHKTCRTCDSLSCATDVDGRRTPVDSETVPDSRSQQLMAATAAVSKEGCRVDYARLKYMA